ncbi:MAG: glycosyltransferase [Muribaculaceae bacterium]|nr:glycosyltransferase [Muribaculaceae bacterium]
MKKPRLFIAMHYLEIGGAEAALIGLLHALDPEKVEVDLFLHAHRGEMLGLVPQWVNLLPEIPAYAAIEKPVKEIVWHGHLAVAAARWIARKRVQRYQRRSSDGGYGAEFGYVAASVAPVLPSLRRFGRYDLAISFLAPHNYVLRHVDAAHKACWIHTDYSRVGIDSELEMPVWNGYDSIVSISPAVTETFCSRFPGLRDKIVEIGNISPVGHIRESAMSGRPSDMPSRPDRMQLLTVGRFAGVKRMHLIPALCRRLVERGLDVEWFLIGYGGDEKLICSNIAKEGMQQRVHILGKRENPYPYIAACDCYVQPSTFEGNSVTVREAQILGRPVVITDYPTAGSQVRDGVDGVIVPMQPDECAEGLARVLSSPETLAKLSENAMAGDYSNAGEVERIYKLAGL